MLNTKTVVGEPITVEGNTLIPLISVGFGFGVGAGEGTDPKKGGGTGDGAAKSSHPHVLTLLHQAAFRRRVYRLAAAAQNLRGADVKIEAEYLDPVFEFQARGRLLLVPLQLLILAIAFALSPVSLRAWRTLKGRHA